MEKTILFSDLALSKIQKILVDNKFDNCFVRLYISGQSCAGLMYGLTLDNEVLPDDVLYDKQNVNIRVNKEHDAYIKSSVINWQDNDVGGGFTVNSLDEEEGGCSGSCGSCSCGSE